MNDYTQPFYIGFNNPRFRYARNGYLPALEYPEEVSKTPQQVIETEWSARQWDTVQQLKAQVLYLQSKVVELSKKRRDDLPFRI